MIKRLRLSLEEVSKKIPRTNGELEDIGEKIGAAQESLRACQEDFEASGLGQRQLMMRQTYAYIQEQVSLVKDEFEELAPLVRRLVPMLPYMFPNNPRLPEIIELLELCFFTNCHGRRQRVRSEGELRAQAEVLAQYLEANGSMNDVDMKKIESRLWDESMKEINQTFESCPICYSDYEPDDEMRVLSCGHGYHSCCLETWLKKIGNCPFCKAKAT